ncbi:unnamed protein product [Sphagnum balticum]
MDALQRDDLPARELYALLHLSLDASDEDVKKPYRQWAEIYHPDKASNSSGLELGPKLKSREEMKSEFECLQLQQEERQLAAHVHHRGSLLLNLSLVELSQSFDSPRIHGMAMSTEIQARISKKDTIVLGGNMALRQGQGGGSVTVVLRQQLSPISSVEVLAMVGLCSILSFQTSRQLSAHATGTLALSWSLTDRSLTLANTWSRELSEDTTGNIILCPIQLLIGPDTGVVVGWQRHGKKNAGSGELKVGPGNFGASAHYIHHFSSKSQGRITGKVGSMGVEVEIGGERRISEHSAAAMFCVLGLQILLSTTLDPLIATGALVLPSSLYTILKMFVIKPYNVRRKQQKSLEQQRLTVTQVLDARASSAKAQLLLKNVAEQKRQKQAQTQGLVILEASYGDIRACQQGATSSVDDSGVQPEDDDSDLPPPYLDVTIPLQFLVDDSSQLQVVVGDYDELRIPQEAHRVSSGHSPSENLDQVD